MTVDELKQLKIDEPKSKRKTCPDEKSFLKGGLTYIKQVKYEQRHKKPLNREAFSKPTSWGIFLEKRAFDLVDDLEYRLVSKKRYVHQTIENWSGMPDLEKPLHVGDIKCPVNLEVFSDKLEALKDIEVYKVEYDEDYWQLISNACLLESNGMKIEKIVAVLYVPFESELEDIHDDTNNWEGDPSLVFWINNAGKDELPHLLDEQDYYNNMNIFTFDIPREDMNYLTERVKLANTMLNE